MDAQKNRSNVILRDKRRPESTHLITDTHIGSSVSNSGHDTITKPAIWLTLEEAKRKQDTIRNRFRKYGHTEEDSDYNDSPLSDNGKQNRIALDIGSDNSESDSNEYDDEFDLNVPLDSMKVHQQNTMLSQKYASASSGSISTARKNRSSGASHSRSLKYYTHENNTNISVRNKGMQRVRSNMTHSAQNYSLNTRKGEKLPVLTSDEAIKLVMERNAYISDSERTEDDHPSLTRKVSLSKGSSSTNETAINSVASDSGHNRTPDGKRVLVLKRKKYREDTHPRTSKNKNDQRNYHQEPHRRSSRPQRNIGKHSTSQKKKDKDEKQQYSTPRVSTPIKKVEESPSSTIQLTQSAKQDISRPLESLTLSRERSAMEEIEIAPHCHRKEKEDKMKRRQSQDSKNHFEKARDYEKTANNSSQLQVPHVARAALDNEDMIEEELIHFDTNHKGYCSDSDTNRHDGDFRDVHEDITQRPSNRSRTIDVSIAAIDKEIVNNLDDKEDKNDGSDSHLDDEEDWRGVSWKTAKTSRSAISKYSKSSSVSLWIKTMEKGDSANNQDDDIFFFDAIQEAGQTSSNESDNNESKRGHDDTVGPREGGWRGKITDFVGYTIGALKGDVDNNIGGDNEGGGTTSAASSGVASSSSKSRGLSNNPPEFPGSTNAVPSRELEIIRKCQELMKSQRNLVETREMDASRKNIHDIRLRRKEEAARARVWREVIAYREMMEGMGRGDKLAPLDSKAAAQEYDDRLAMVKTLEDQEMKIRMHERNMVEMETGKKIKTNVESNNDPGGCCCACTIS